MLYPQRRGIAIIGAKKIILEALNLPVHVPLLPLQAAHHLQEYAPSFSHLRNLSLISSTSTLPHALVLAQVASAILVSSDQVPSG